MRTIEYYQEMRHRLAKSANQTQNTHLKRELWAAFSKCDVSIARLVRYYRSIKVWVIAINIAVLLTILTGCNAVGGLGRDITWMGEAGQEMLEHGHKAMEK